MLIQEVKVPGGPHIHTARKIYTTGLSIARSIYRSGLTLVTSYSVLTVFSLLSWQIRWHVGVEDVSARLAVLAASLQAICSGPWRIAGWIGNVIFDGVVTALTLFRAIRLRKTGVRVTLAERMLQDGIYYFGKQLLKS